MKTQHTKEKWEIMLEDIEKQALKYYGTSYGKSIFIHGAKWMREQLQSHQQPTDEIENSPAYDRITGMKRYKGTKQQPVKPISEEEIMKNLPKKIYLQVDPQPYGYTDFDEAYKEQGDEITWCQDRINKNDVVYVPEQPSPISNEILLRFMNYWNTKMFEYNAEPFAFITIEFIDNFKSQLQPKEYNVCINPDCDNKVRINNFSGWCDDCWKEFQQVEHEPIKENDSIEDIVNDAAEKCGGKAKIINQEDEDNN